MWIWRKMEKISWTAKVSNSEVLNRVKENSCIINTINQWKHRWLGHVLRHDVLLRDILEGRMTGKCTRSRKRLQLMSNICEGYETAKKQAEYRCLWCVEVMGVSDLLNSRIPEEEEEEEEEAQLKFGQAPSIIIIPQVSIMQTDTIWLEQRKFDLARALHKMT